MRNKLGFLIGISLKKKVKSKWFLIANIVIALLVVGIINIDSIIKDSMKAYDNWIKNSKNKGKEFRYEIDNNTPDN